MQWAKRKYSRTIENNLKRAYACANADDIAYGLNWYQIAHDVACKLADDYGCTVKQACGVIAALSPGRNWEVNQDDAKTIIAHYSIGKRGKELPLVGSYGWGNIIKAERILSGESPLDVLGGEKVRSFFCNIYDPTSEECVTIDRHAKSAALGEVLGDKGTVPSKGEYLYLSEHYRKLAAKLNLLPHQLQAIVWVVWRRLGGNLELQPATTELAA